MGSGRERFIPGGCYIKMFIKIMLTSMMLSSCLVFASGRSERDKYVGLSIEDVIEELDDPKGSSEIFYDKNYSYNNEIEPDYSKHLSKNEREVGVIIKVFVWEKWRKRIIVWTKMINNQWVVFSSIEYNPAWVQF
jgi:hypothetical protein